MLCADVGMFRMCCPNDLLVLHRRFAQDRCAKLDMKKHHVLKSVHPSPLSAHRVRQLAHAHVAMTFIRLRFWGGSQLLCCFGVSIRRMTNSAEQMHKPDLTCMGAICQQSHAE
jgi:hypothetical protein